MGTKRSDTPPDLEALLTVLSMALMASHPDFDTERFSTLLRAAAAPEGGLEGASSDMLERIATSATEWAQARRCSSDPEQAPDSADIVLH